VVLSRQWASSRYRSTSPVRGAGRAFDCGERWVRVDGRVCGLMYVFCYCTAREDGMFYVIVVAERFGFWADWESTLWAISFRVACVPQ